MDGILLVAGLGGGAAALPLVVRIALGILAASALAFVVVFTITTRGGRE